MYVIVTDYCHIKGEPEGGVQALNLREHFSDITVDPKVKPDGTTFWSGFEARDPLASAWRTRLFPAKSLNHDFSSLIDR